jgi:hypothetical protein
MPDDVLDDGSHFSRFSAGRPVGFSDLDIPILEALRSKGVECFN